MEKFGRSFLLLSVLSVAGCGDDASMPDASAVDANADTTLDAQDAVVTPDAGADPLRDGPVERMPPLRTTMALCGRRSGCSRKGPASSLPSGSSP